jgi:hypothetical protein
MPFDRAITSYASEPLASSPAHYGGHADSRTQSSGSHERLDDTQLVGEQPHAPAVLVHQEALAGAGREVISGRVGT